MNDPVLEALRSLPTPSPPPVEQLLARAFPDGLVRRPRVSVAVLAAASISTASLPLILPGSQQAHVWGEGLVRRGEQWSSAVVEILGEDQR
ncbi:MAG: hypothetical protein O2816_09465 [Planctomycetota bacterium]|nr:hypothetical protein [Planctomycetota bacterium]